MEVKKALYVISIFLILIINLNYISSNENINNIVDGKRITKNFGGNVSNKNSLIDYIIWNLNPLLKQSYELIINITKAEQLDSDRVLIEDVYNYVKSRDDNWTLIPDSDYLRVTFEQKLTSDRDITIYAKSDVLSSVEVYEKDSNIKIAEFENILEDKKYKIYLTNLESDSQDVFDLKSVGNVEFDYVVDPFPSPIISDYQILSSSGNNLTSDNISFNYSFSSNFTDASFWKWYINDVETEGYDFVYTNESFYILPGNVDPNTIAYDEVNDYFWVGDNDEAGVFKYFGNWTYTGESFYLDYPTDGFPAHGIVYYDGYLWMLQNYNTIDGIYKFWTNGTYTGESFDIGGVGNDRGAGIVYYDGYFWTIDYLDDDIYKYWTNGTYTGENFDISGNGDDYPDGITYYDGYFWILGGDSGEVYKHWTNGTYTEESFTIENYSSKWTTAHDYDIKYANGYFWITDWYYNKIYKYWTNGTYTGESIEDLYDSGGSSVADSFTYADGYLYSLAYDNNVFKYWTNGTYTGEKFSLLPENSSKLSYVCHIVYAEDYLWISHYLDSNSNLSKFWTNGTYTGESYDIDFDCDYGGMTYSDGGLWINYGQDFLKYWTNGTYTGESFNTSDLPSSYDEFEITYANGYFWILGVDTSTLFSVFKYWTNGTYTGENYDITSLSPTYGITYANGYFWTSQLTFGNPPRYTTFHKFYPELIFSNQTEVGDVVAIEVTPSDSEQNGTAENRSMTILPVLTTLSSSDDSDESSGTIMFENGSKYYDFSLDQDLLTIDLVKGEYLQRYIVVQNKGDTIDIDVNVSSELDEFISSNEESFRLGRNDDSKIRFDIFALESSEAGSYVGKLNFNSEEVSKSVDVKLNVYEKYPLFTLETEVPKNFIIPGKEVEAVINVGNPRNIENLKGTLKYSIIDFDNSVYDSGVEEIVLENSSVEKQIELKLPKGIITGKYILYAQVFSEEEDENDFDLFYADKISLLISALVFLMILLSIILASFLLEINVDEIKNKIKTTFKRTKNSA